jgi:5-hydroxyisourate hydrolase-like protein (transthyretin family)
MEKLRHLLATIAALTLLMSVVSSVNPSYFVGSSAYADNNNRGDSVRESEDYDEFVQLLGNHSKVKLIVDDDARLEIKIQEGDLQNGTYDVIFTCDSPDINKEFADALVVEDGQGESEIELSLSRGKFTGCEVEVGSLSASFRSFSVMTHEDDDSRRHEEREHERDLENKTISRLKTDDDGVQVKIELEGLDLADGSYDAVFACEQPSFNKTLADAFEVEDGEGELETEIGLANGTYSGCDITVEGMMIASFDKFTVSEETEEEQERRVEEKRKEKKERIVTSITGRDIHEKHRGERAASPGEYEPGWEYILNANGTAMHRNQTEAAGNASAMVNLNMTIWKSTGAIILLDVIDGTAKIGNETYTVVLGYALYTIHHDTLRIGALAVDDDGNVYRLRLSGSAVNDDAEFPMESGSIDLDFEGSRGPPDRFGNWSLTLEGTVVAG